MWKYLGCLAVLIGSCVAGAEAAPQLVARIPAFGGDRPQLSVTPIDLRAAARCFQPAAIVEPRAVVAAVRGPNGLQAVPTQFDSLGDAANPLAGELTVLLPPGSGGRDLVVFLAAAPDAPRPVAPPAPVVVSQQNGVVRVTSATYRVTHDAGQLAGLPSRIELRPSGKVFSGYTFNDRLWSHQGTEAGKGGYWLVQDQAAKLEVVAAGPLRAVVRVSARYTRGAETPKSQPRAVYTFAYTGHSPLVDLQVACSQEAAAVWDELHVVELHFKDNGFPGWVGGEPTEEGQFTNTKKGWQKTWGGLRDGDSVIGLLGAGVTRFYDGRDEYGIYLHGPWEQWSSESGRYRVSLFLSGAAGSVDALRQAAASNPLPLLLSVLPETTAQAIAAARSRIGSAPAPLAARLGWWARLTETIARSDLDRAHALATSLADDAALRPLAADGRRLDEWFEQRTGLLGLASDQLAVAFESGQLVSLYDVKGDREMLGAPSPLWVLKLREADKKTIEVSPAAWRTAGLKVSPQVVRLGQPRAPGLRLTFRDLPMGQGAAKRPAPEVELDVQLVGPRLTTHLKVNNRTTAAVEHVQTPVVRLGMLGGNGADDVFCFPRGAGEIQQDPVGRGVHWGGLYPSGWSSMQYLAVYDPAGGLYLAAEDPAASTKETFGRGPDGQGTVAYGVEWPLPDMIVPGNDWNQPGEGALELFRGDWYDAAQVYRRWAEAKAQWWPARAKAKQVPQRFRDNAVWVCDGATPYEPNNTVARTLAFARFMGVPTAIHWYNWHQIPFDTEYPHYDPPKARMAEGVKELQRGGVAVMPYINARLWDSWLDDFKQEAHRYATCDEQGKPYLEIYGSKRSVKVKVKNATGEEERTEQQPVALAAMCPVTPYWQDKVRSIVLWLQNEVGVDGVYMDQVAAASPRLCMNKAHGHPLGGGDWWCTQGYWPLLAKLRGAMKSDKFITTECNSEPFMQYYDGYLSWHWQYEHQVPAFSAVYADQVALFSRAYGGGKDADLAMRQKAAQSLVFGEQIGWLSASVINQKGAVFLRECARMRHLLRDWLANGRMVRPPALSGPMPTLTADWQWSGVWPVTLPAVQTGAWRARDGRVVVILANFSPQPVTVTAKLDLADYGYVAGAAPRVTARRTDGDSPAGTWANGVTPPITVPAEQVLAFELAAP